MQSISILGSTGSIGLSAVKVIKTFPDKFKIYGLACNSNLSLLSKQISEFKPAVAAIGDKSAAATDFVKKLIKENRETEFLFGNEGIIELASRKTDMVISSISGSAGLRPSIAALDGCKRLALANKETLVMAGDIFTKLTIKKGVELIPVDSEHSAVFSLLSNLKKEEVEQIILTASGGSLKDYPAEDLKDVTPEIALKHPTWNMGSKITIDSATLMNKGLEVIEAHHLFNFSYDNIKAVIHPESIIHSMVETIDGAVYAHMGKTDMVFPILNALTYPAKIKNPFGRIDFTEIGSLNFRKYDSNKFPALDLCYYAGRTGGNMPAVLNGANETAVYSFLEKKIRFTDIIDIVEKTINSIDVINNPDIKDIFESDCEAKNIALSFIKMKQ
ncbi:MAG: 1-deoxy-D-xylulose-5-phosphate reductoisomerase [Spirochaetes bacterium]|nr:1-deoxy-D-xylulose-5-phosphate reductoisomerase [Spirochaetota bacterium]